MSYINNDLLKLKNCTGEAAGKSCESIKKSTEIISIDISITHCIICHKYQLKNCHQN